VDPHLMKSITVEDLPKLAAHASPEAVQLAGRVLRDDAENQRGGLSSVPASHRVP
jgi:hypothetical protein